MKMYPSNKLYRALIIGGVIVLIIIVGSLFWGCDDKGGGQKERPPQNEIVGFCPPTEVQAKIDKWGGTYPHVYETQRGVMVYSGVEVPATALAKLDEAMEFSVRVQKVQFPEWQKWTTAQEFEVWFVEADGLAEQSQLPYITRGGVKTAGTVAFCDNTTRKQRTPAFLPDFRLVNWQKDNDLFWYAFNEWEHSREIQNDVGVAKRFFISTDEHPHKHEGKPSARDLLPKTLVSKPVPQMSCGFGVK